MPECEICGKRVDTVYEITLDGAQLLVCEKDARGHEVRSAFGRQEKKQGRASEPVQARGGEQEELAEDYGERIRKAREAMGLPLVVLAERISEKESTLARIEKQKMLPSEKTRQKLEKELGIRLISKSAESRPFVESRKSEPTTLWDMVKKDKEEGD